MGCWRSCCGSACCTRAFMPRWRGAGGAVRADEARCPWRQPAPAPRARLVPVNGFFVVPLFGMANAGVELGQMGLPACSPPAAGDCGRAVRGQAPACCGRDGGRPAGHRPAPQGRRMAHIWGMALCAGSALR
jgi:hypothetical protein